MSTTRYPLDAALPPRSANLTIRHNANLAAGAAQRARVSQAIVSAAANPADLAGAFDIRVRAPLRQRLAVVILTLNEELNLPHALNSVVGWADSVIVLDSGSTDRTRSIAKDRGCVVIEHPFDGYSNQRNRGIEAARGLAQWILFLDADEWVTPELREEIDRVLSQAAKPSGYFIKRRLIWMGRWVRRGYYPVWILRLAHVDRVRCEERAVNEHLIVDGAMGRLASDFVHEDRKPLDDWIRKHVSYAEKEAFELTQSTSHQLPARLIGPQAERKRWVRQRIWNRLPPLFRPVVYFVYRYFFRGGFLDGAAGFSYHALQGFWFHLLIDMKYLEGQRTRGRIRPTYGAGSER